MEKKTCSMCGQTLPLSYFHKNGRLKDGYRSCCKDCYKMRYLNKENTHYMVNGVECKKCSVCGEMLPLTEYYTQKRTGDGLRYMCKKCHVSMCGRMKKEKKELKAALKGERPSTAKSKPRSYQVIRVATDGERCSRCKSYSKCSPGDGFCLRHKRGVKRGNTCDDWMTNSKKQYQQIATQVALCHSNPYD